MRCLVFGEAMFEKQSLLVVLFLWVTGVHAFGQKCNIADENGQCKHGCAHSLVTGAIIFADTASSGNTIVVARRQVMLQSSNGGDLVDNINIYWIKDCKIKWETNLVSSFNSKVYVASCGDSVILAIQEIRNKESVAKITTIHQGKIQSVDVAINEEAGFFLTGLVVNNISKTDKEAIVLMIKNADNPYARKSEVISVDLKNHKIKTVSSRIYPTEHQEYYFLSFEVKNLNGTKDEIEILLKSGQKFESMRNFSVFEYTKMSNIFLLFGKINMEHIRFLGLISIDNRKNALYLSIKDTLRVICYEKISQKKVWEFKKRITEETKFADLLDPKTQTLGFFINTANGTVIDSLGKELEDANYKKELLSLFYKPLKNLESHETVPTTQQTIVPTTSWWSRLYPIEKIVLWLLLSQLILYMSLHIRNALAKRYTGTRLQFWVLAILNAFFVRLMLMPIAIFNLSFGIPKLRKWLLHQIQFMGILEAEHHAKIALEAKRVRESAIKKQYPKKPQTRFTQPELNVRELITRAKTLDKLSTLGSQILDTNELTFFLEKIHKLAKDDNQALDTLLPVYEQLPIGDLQDQCWAHIQPFVKDFVTWSQKCSADRPALSKRIVQALVMMNDKPKDWEVELYGYLSDEEKRKFEKSFKKSHATFDKTVAMISTCDTVLPFMEKHALELAENNDHDLKLLELGIASEQIIKKLLEQEREPYFLSKYQLLKENCQNFQLKTLEKRVNTLLSMIKPSQFVTFYTWADDEGKKLLKQMFQESADLTSADWFELIGDADAQDEEELAKFFAQRFREAIFRSKAYDEQLMQLVEQPLVKTYLGETTVQRLKEHLWAQVTY